MTLKQTDQEPAQLLSGYLSLLTHDPLPGPVLDLACGEGRNGIYLAKHKMDVICCDISQDALDRVGQRALNQRVGVQLWHADLEEDNTNPLPDDAYGAILVFRYLHRPLLPCIRRALKTGGFLFYETYTIDQPQFGKPRNPAHLLKPGELKDWFGDWRVIHCFEGIKHNPERAVAQIVCRRPAES